MELVIYSVFAPLKSLGVIIRSKKLVKLSLLPLLIGIVMYSILIAVLWHYFPYFMDKFNGTPDGFFAEIWYYIKTVFFIVVAVLSIVFTFSLVVNIIASPFNERLSREILKQQGIPLAQDPSFLKEVGRIIVVETKKSLFLLLIAVVMFILSFIPIFSLISFFVTASLLAFAYVDYPLEVQKVPFKARINFYFEHIVQMGILGSIFSILLSVPILNLFMIPTLTGAGTLYYVKAYKKKEPA